jgi:thiamine monophosphate synthase
MALREALAGHAGTTLLVRARPDIAGAVGADGVLLAGGSLPVLVARRTMQASAEGPERSRLVAKSVATLVAAKQAEREGAELLVLEVGHPSVSSRVL